MGLLKTKTALQNLPNQDMGLVLSTDAKPRLKWTSELHQRFVEAVNQLGGPDKATPKSLMRMMGIPGLTLYHLKSHLQKYRLGKNQQSETQSAESKEHVVDQKESLNELQLFTGGSESEDSTQDQIKENVRVAQAIQMQMEVQRKLHEQIEVQRHLQLRIEAQGKYLQKVLKKAQETLSTYSCSSSAGVEHAKAELSQLVSMVSNSSFSELTDLSLENQDQKATLRGAGCSVESSLTSSESSEDRDISISIGFTPPLTLPLLDKPQGASVKGKKRGTSTNLDDGGCVEQTASKKRSTSTTTTQGYYREEAGQGLNKFDLNIRCDQSELDLLGLKKHSIDLNSKQFNHHL